MSKYQPGQVWTYKARAGEEDSRVTILKIDEHEILGNIVHLHISGVTIMDPPAPDRFAKVIHHAPFALAAVEDSVLEVQSEKVDLPEFREGYEIWKEAFEDGKAGVFTVSIAAGIEAMAQSLQSVRSAQQ